ncbi:50S ribosomal protein L23 [Alienimonas californiensis]|uniref:Large ribosomal subunit protein uL23 n=1 Tax=Alienimonas californiensis TaxID=2527989 RepID=A0A517P9I5_9PLAN|nr:50S ribosomal protein L23 [Alienimonas californiensis]QDT16033.1 50S ribosomal protein L23 [Alienimonas californiensis]
MGRPVPPKPEQFAEDRKVDLDPYSVILRPLVTEKGTHLSERHNAYTFEVHPLANKFDVKNAVQTIWSVRVDKVRTQNRAGKTKRTRSGLGRTRSWKKAVVKLHAEDQISFF